MVIRQPQGTALFMWLTADAAEISRLAGLGSTIGVRATLLAGAVGQSLTFLPVFLSPLRRMRELPSYAESAEDGHPTASPLAPTEP